MNQLKSLILKIFTWKKNVQSIDSSENNYLNKEISLTLIDFIFNNNFKSNVKINGRYIRLSEKFINRTLKVKRSPIIIIEYSYRLPSPVNNNKFTVRKQGSSVIVIKEGYFKHFNVSIENSNSINTITNLVTTAIKKDLRNKDCGEISSRGK